MEVWKDPFVFPSPYIAVLQGVKKMTDTVELVVNGTLMRGLALNKNLLRVGARFLYETLTAPEYRLWSIDDEYPAMIRIKEGGVSVTVEVWELPVLGLFMVFQQEPPGLCLGMVKLNDGKQALGILGEPYLCEGKKEISAFGGWRAYLESKPLKK